MNDSFDLQRFLDAQERIYEDVIAELQSGHKRSHWMWFVFPQIAGLGSSSMALRYAIRSRAEAEAYLAHPVLGPRLRECTRLVNKVKDRSAERIFGGIDALKFRSSMTLFSEVAGENSEFHQALLTYFGGEPDPLTIERL